MIAAGSMMLWKCLGVLGVTILAIPLGIVQPLFVVPDVVGHMRLSSVKHGY